MCHSFETYDPKIAIREVEARLTTRAPDFSFAGHWVAAAIRICAAALRMTYATPRKEAVE